jgi:hypothetical protein
MTGCLIRVYGRQTNDAKWKTERVHSGPSYGYNDGSNDGSAFPEICRKLLEPLLESIIADWNRGITPAKILANGVRTPFFSACSDGTSRACYKGIQEKS